MRRTLGVGVVLLFAALLLPVEASAQQSGDRTRSRLEQNYPNPFNPTTRIPFTLFEEDFRDGKPAVVSIRIRTILGHLVAIPNALDHPAGKIEVLNLEYTAPGRYEAHFDGFDRLGNKVASGPILLEMVINGERQPPKLMMVAK